MVKRVISVLLITALLIAIPLCVSAAGEKDVTDAGTVTIGTVELGGDSFSFIYSPALTINKSLAALLSGKLGEYGAMFECVRFDYEMLNRQGIFVICGEDGNTEYLAANTTLEISLFGAFPEYELKDYQPQHMDDSVASDECVELSGDRTTAIVVIEAEPEYIEREVNGEIYQVLMVSDKPFRYEVQNVVVKLSADNQPEAVDTSETDLPEETSNTTTTTTATTTAAAVTTTAAATTTATTTTAAATSASTETEATMSAVETPLDEIGYVITKRMNLRVHERPSMDSPVIALLAKGEQVYVIGAVGMEWYKIKLPDGRAGYCAAQYIEVK